MTISGFSRLTRPAILASCLGAALFLQGCASPGGAANTYNLNQAQREQTVRMAVVESVRTVKIEGGDASGIGVLGGGALGAVAGSAFGGGRGSLLTGIAGGIAGAMAGNTLEGRYRSSKGIEITVTLENGQLRAITQADTGEIFRAGQRVRLLTSDGVTRVTL